MQRLPRLSIIFRIQRFIRFLLKGIGKKETEHFLFNITYAQSDFGIYTAMAGPGWSPYYMGYVYKHQIYQCRKLVDWGKHQYHVRFYDDGNVTGHFETTPEWSVVGHLQGDDLRTMNIQESIQLRGILERWYQWHSEV